MKVLGLVCSPRRGGNTEMLVKEALKAASDAGGETEMLCVADLKIAPCDGCDACREKGICKIKDDMQIVYEKMKSADGIIFGTPVYFLNVTAQAKALMDRTYALLGVKGLRGKVAAAVVAARRIGAGEVLGLLYTYFTVQRMIISGGGAGYGREKGEVAEGVGDAHGFSALEEARAIGRNVVWMVNRFSQQKS